MPTAGAASTGARRAAAAGARRLPLPGQELLHRGEVPRPRRVEKFLLLPHGESHGIQRGLGEGKRKEGLLGVGSGIPLFSLSLSPPPAPDLKLFLSAAGAVARKQKLPPPAGCVPPDPRCRWRWRRRLDVGGKFL